MAKNTKKTVELQGTKSVRPNGSYAYKLNDVVLACIKEGKKHTTVYLPKRMGQDLDKLQADFGKTLGQYIKENPTHIKNPKDAFFAKMDVPVNVKIETLLAKLESLGTKVIARQEKEKSEKSKAKSEAKNPTPAKSEGSKAKSETPARTSSASDTRAEMLALQQAAIEKVRKEHEEKASAPVQS